MGSTSWLSSNTGSRIKDPWQHVLMGVHSAADWTIVLQR